MLYVKVLVVLAGTVNGPEKTKLAEFDNEVLGSGIDALLNCAEDETYASEVDGVSVTISTV